MMKQLKNVVTRFFDFLWLIFLNGLLTILPIVLTIALFNIVLKILTGWLEPIRRLLIGISHKIPALQPVINFLFTKIPYFEVIIALLTILAMGIVIRIFILRTLWHALEHFFLRLPLIRTVYSGVKQMITAFDPQNESFQKVVIVQFPRLGMYSIGFLAGEISPTFAPDNQHTFVSVYVPTTPNPTTGFYLMVPIAEVIMTDLNRQEATAMIISGGIIQPERFAKK